MKIWSNRKNGMSLLFLKSLRYRWFEYTLAGTVVAVVIAVVISVRTLSVQVDKQIHDLTHNLGGNMLVVPAGTNLADFYAFKYGDSSMPESYIEKIQNSKLNIGFIQSRLYGNVEVDATPLVLVGEKTISRGNEYSPVSRESVIVGESVFSGSGMKETGNLNIQGESRTFQTPVDRVINPAPDGLDIGLFTSLGMSQKVLNKPGEINAMRLGGCWCSVDVTVLASQVEDTLPGTKAITVEGMIKAQKGTVETVKRYSAIIYAVAIILIIVIVSILISSQVRRQKRQIGLLLAIGTAPYIVSLLFIIKAGLVGVIGSLLGYLLGYPLINNVGSVLMGTSLSIPEGSLLIVLIASLTVSILSALFPALHAARLDPTEILREV
jgi:putative ABC transport system permease protein